MSVYAAFSVAGDSQAMVSDGQISTILARLQDIHARAAVIEEDPVLASVCEIDVSTKERRIL